MNKKDLRKLIELYSEYKVDDIEDNGQLLCTKFDKPTRHDLLKIEEFSEYKEIVKDLKQDLEGNVIRPGATAQVIDCLKLVLNKALYNPLDLATYKERMKILGSLMWQTYANNWGSKEKNHFLFLYPRLRDWNIFFFSYPNRGANFINSRYRNMIDSIFVEGEEGGTKLSSEALKEDNLVAELLVQGLARNNYSKGFYDKKDIQTGDRLAPEIEKKCKNSFLFIQLVTPYTFVYKPVNWSFIEYKSFQSHRTQSKNAKDNPEYFSKLRDGVRFALCGTKEEVTPEGVFPGHYKKWYQDATSDRRFEALPSLNSDQFDKIIKKIVQSMTDFLEKDLIENIP